jgi:type IV secretory pathway VirB10-like protein
MSDTSPSSAKQITSPTELEKPKFVQLHGRVIGSGRLSNRAAIITLAFLAIIIGLIIYGASQNKLRLPQSTAGDAAVIPAAQVAPWWQNESDAMPTPKTVPTISPSAVPSTGDLQSVPDLAQIDSADSPGTTSSPTGPARIVSVLAQPYTVNSFPSIPQLPAAVSIAPATSPTKNSADANEPPGDAQSLNASALVGVGMQNPAPTPGSGAPSVDSARQSLVLYPTPISVRSTADIAPMQGATSTSPYTLLAGTIVSASLVTAIDSDTAGTLLAQVTADAYDSVTGRFLLIPRGSRLIGTYDARISYGQDRLGVVWTRLIFPNGASLDLGNIAGSDEAGRSGFDAQVDQHTRKLFEGALLMSILGAGAQLSQPPQSANLVAAPSVGQSIAGAVGSQVAEVGTQVAQRELNVAPNLRVPAGYSFTVIINHDMSFSAPYAGH